MENGILIAVETPQDEAVREALLDRVMGPIRFRRSSQRIREGRVAALALAAHDAEGNMAGTVQLWHVGARGLANALMLGPLAVAPEAQGLGIGGKLMRAAIEMSQAAGFGAIILVGDAEYYARFGFSAEVAGNLAMPGPFERHRLLGLELAPGTLAPAIGVLRGTGPRRSTAAGRRSRKVA